MSDGVPREAPRAQAIEHLRRLAADGVWGLPLRNPPGEIPPGTAASDAAPLRSASRNAAATDTATPEPVAPKPGTSESEASPAARPSAPDSDLAAAEAEALACTACRLCETRTKVVFGVGDPSARLMFIGEGPGRDEDLRGEPFVGAAGQLLDKIIVAMGLSRQQVYIANTVKCRPPRNRNPEPEELDACRSFLVRQVEAVSPEVIVLLGRVAAQAVLDSDAPLGRLRGRFVDWNGIPVMCTYHPAYLLRNPADKRKVWEDIQQVMARLGLQRS